MADQRLFVAPVSTQKLSALDSDRSYHGVLASVGYESRSRAAVQALSERAEQIAGLEFPRGHEASYAENRESFESLGASLEEVSDGDVSGWIGNWLEQLAQKHGSVRAAVDVSSMTRPRIAGTVQAIVEAQSAFDLTVDLVYVPAAFQFPPDVPDATEAVEVVTPWFAGAPLDPDLPDVLLFGLGYEAELAASAIDELAPSMSFPFFPIGSDSRYIRSVGSANSDVLCMSDVAKQRNYEVGDPFRTFWELESLVESLIRENYRPIFLPFGPKIFATCCMLVSAMASTRIPVWRVSPGHLGGIVDQEPGDELVTLRVATRPIPET